MKTKTKAATLPTTEQDVLQKLKHEPGWDEWCKARDMEEGDAYKLGMKAATEYIARWRPIQFKRYCEARDGEIGGRPFLHLTEILPKAIKLCPFIKAQHENLYEAWMGGFDFVCRGSLK